MFSNQFLAKINSYFPSFTIEYKNQSIFMKFLGILLFFSKSFMVDYTTTIGDTVYFPDQTFVNTKPVTSVIVLLHELVHMHDERKLGKIIYSFLYLFPQILFLPSLLLFFLSWKLALPILLVLLTPLPAYFRMMYEKRAYMAALYSMNALNNKHKYNIDLHGQANYFATQFHGPFYYYMWPFNDIGKEFDDAVAKISSGARPYDDKVFDMLDDVLTVL